MISRTHSSQTRATKKIIQFVCGDLRNIRTPPVIAEADTNLGIVKSVIEELNRIPQVIVVGSVTDLLVLLVAFALEDNLSKITSS